MKKDVDHIDYDFDSEQEWEDEGSGEELNSSNDASDEGMLDIDSDADEEVPLLYSCLSDIQFTYIHYSYTKYISSFHLHSLFLFQIYLIVSLNIQSYFTVI